MPIYITIHMNLEKPKQPIIWNGGTTFHEDKTFLHVCFLWFPLASSAPVPSSAAYKQTTNA
jgi:hypothetical protein